MANGGWSVFQTFGGAIAYAYPATSQLVREDGTAGWFGWPSNPAVEGFVQDWLDAREPAARTDAAHKAGALALQDGATIPTGQFYVKTAFRTSVRGVVQAPAPYPFNVELA